MQNITRRTLTQRFSLAAGSSLLLPGIAAAAARPTPSQTQGPFYPVHEADDLDADLTRIEGIDGQAQGEVILVGGRVFGPEGAPLTGALIDVWQANHHGRYIHPRDRNPAPLDPNFQGWAKMRSDADGSYRFKTILPGPYSLQSFGVNGVRCRHIHFRVSHPASRSLTTQMYFAGDPLMARDPVMSGTPSERRAELIAQRDGDFELPLYHFDIILAAA